MVSSFFQAATIGDAEVLAPIARDVHAEISATGYTMPEAFIGDLVLALSPRMSGQRSNAQGAATVENMWRKLPGMRSWRHVARGLESLRRTCRRTPQVHDGALRWVAREVCKAMLQPVRIDHGKPAELPTLIGEAFEAAVEVSGMDADWPIGPLIIVAAELTRRAAVLKHLDVWIDIDLIGRCLAKEWLAEVFKARQLQLVARLGDDSEALPGDFLSVRGITKKLREDQIPKILPSEYALWHVGANGKTYTLDKVINRSPSCYENFDTRRPEAEHRLLIVFAMDVDHLRAKEFTHKDLARTKATRALAFSLLVHAAMRVPHGNIKADVVWVERRGLWRGSSFPLRAFHVSPFDEDHWRNTANMDAMVPGFLTGDEIGARTGIRHDVMTHRQSPQELLTRFLATGRYHAACVAAFGSNGSMLEVLPSGATPLPTFDSITPTVLCASVEPGEAPGEEKTRAGLHRTLMAARVSASREEVEEAELAAAWLWMLIGPSAGGVPPAILERKMKT